MHLAPRVTKGSNPKMGTIYPLSQLVLLSSSLLHDCSSWIFAGRRNGTIEKFSIHKARSGWQPERVLKFPAGSGAVSCVRPMVNGRHDRWRPAASSQDIEDSARRKGRTCCSS